MIIEVNLDGLVGPTHHYGGLGVGNLASHQHAFCSSHPRAAALEGLRKAQLVASLGIPQYVLLPPARPVWQWLVELGFEVEDASLTQEPRLQESRLRQVLRSDPRAFSAACSSSFMWAANAATITASVDSRDHRLHITPANLISSWHRSSEVPQRTEQLLQMCARLTACTVHTPLPAIVPLRDEGAANHMRLCSAAGQPGFHVFVYGAEDDWESASTKFFPRHTRAACEAIARRHRLDPQHTFYLRQHPQAIAAGAFHNDVVATSHQHVLLHHELAFVDAQAELTRLERSFQQAAGLALQRIEIADAELSLSQAVSSYLFNSQLVSPAVVPHAASGPRMVLICPHQCQTMPAASQMVQRLIAAPDNPLEAVHFVSLEQSMAGGGGPACLRLRVPLTDQELPMFAPGLRLDGRLADLLGHFIEQWYPEQLKLEELCDWEYAAQLSELPQRLAEEVSALAARPV